MKLFFLQLVAISILFSSCDKSKTTDSPKKNTVVNSIQHAKGLQLYKYDGFSVLKVINPWPNANKNFTYILQEKNGIIPDSLKQNITIQVPIKTVVATSTTHIPSLEMLDEVNSLVGFPNLDYISSRKVRKLINTGKVKELGSNQNLNLEITIDLAPSIIIGYGLDNSNPTLDNLQKSGLKVILNGDWNEQTPLGKAEWIKFFGALYGKEKLAEIIFKNIETEYNKTVQLAQKTTTSPTVLAGALFEDVWYVPQGNSWGTMFLNDAQSNYIWKNSKGTGGLPLSFEKVLEKAQKADFWIGPGQFTSLNEMIKTNPHYTQFNAFKNKNVYSFSTKKGEKGGLVYFEEAPNRPDLVLKDLVKIFHPELLPNYELYFFEKLK